MHKRGFFVGMTVLVTSFLSLTVQAKDKLEYERFALTNTGDAKRGAKLFADQKRTRCLQCHVVGKDGADVGPNLSAIGGKFDRPHLIESLLEPSAQIVEGYRSTTLVKKTGDVFTGVLKNESDGQLTLVDTEAKTHKVAVADVAKRSAEKTSIMPEGLAEALSHQEFTDLIAYLETLRPGGKPKFGGGIIGPISLPEGFAIRTVATGLTGGTALETLDDGRILVCEQTGAVRVIENGKLLEKPFVDLAVHKTGERGVIGVTVDPDFPKTPYVYVCWVAAKPYPHHRISRFTMDNNVAVAGSEKLLLVGDDQNTLGGGFKAGHQGGALHFGSDKKLYVSIGEQTNAKEAQSFGTFQGKILRINADGSVPKDNPFLDRTKGKFQAIWALGCRNPYTFAIHPTNGQILINDVGGKFEEINVGKAGTNYGWGAVEHGPRDANDQYAGPIHWYPQACLAGGDFVLPTSGWPKEYHGRYLFADFNLGWIHSIDPSDGEKATTFAERIRRPIDLRFGPKGRLFVLVRNAWLLDKKFEAGTSSLVEISYSGK